MFYPAGGYPGLYFPLVHVAIHPPLGLPPLRVRNVRAGQPTAVLTTGQGSVRFSSGAPNVRDEEGSD
jgi:hypothetical protein